MQLLNPKEVIFLVNFYSYRTKSSSFPEDCGSCIGFFSSKTHQHKFMRLIAVSLRGIWYCLRLFPTSMRQKSYLLRLFHNSATISAPLPFNTLTHRGTVPRCVDALKRSGTVPQCFKVVKPARSLLFFDYA
jgi:hypothetical protein